MIKTVIKDVLKKKGELSEKKLSKAVLKQLADEYEGKEKEFASKFATELNSLVCKNKVAEKDGVYSTGGDEKIVNNVIEVSSSSSSKATKRPSTTPIEDKKVSKHIKLDVSDSTAPAEDSGVTSTAELWKDGEKLWKEGKFEQTYLEKNPDKITRLFCGNLNRKVTEDELKGCIEGITYIKWITDKESGEFYGSSFLEMKDPISAAAAVMQDKSKFMGRPLKIFYCPPRPGDIWPPKDRGGNGRGTVTGNGPPRREKTPKPDGCKKLFAGNLSYNIDDDAILDFFKACGTICGLRWLEHQDTGEFRGAGFVEFTNTNEAEDAMKMDGKELLGRCIRLDWTD